MYIGRKNELDILNSLWNQNSLGCALLYGKKYVGKTSLISEFVKGKRTVFFSALPSTGRSNLNSFSKALFSCISPAMHEIPLLQDWDALFEEMNTYVHKERIVLVIDDFSNLYHAYPGILFTLQRLLEQSFTDTGMVILLADSSSDFMENTVMASSSPLYGIYTTAIKLAPLDYRETASLFPAYSPEDKALVYGITGGNPFYLSKLDPNTEIKNNIMSAFFLKNGLFLEEPAHIMKQEFRELTTYNAILTAIAAGHNRLNEISEQAELETGLCVKYLKALASMDLIAKETPVASRDRKKSYYKISDYLFRFWYRFVPENMSHIASGRIFLSYLTAVEDHLPAYMEDMFYEIVKEYLTKYCSLIPFEIHSIGKWWGLNPKTKQPTEIDLVATDLDMECGLFGMLRYSSSRPMDISDLHDLKSKSECVKMISEKYYCLISRSGFTDVLKAKAADEDVLLITLQQIYR